MLVAAGSGTRLAAGLPKAFVELAGRSLVQHALDRIAAAGCVDAVVVVVPPGWGDRIAAELPSVLVAEGGATRQESVAAGLSALEAALPARPGDVVLVHDAARCLAPGSLVASVAAAVRAGHPVVVPAVPVHDTVRALVAGDDATHGVVDRDLLRAVQTPQGFDRAVLTAAHAPVADAPGGPVVEDRGAVPPATDDATLAERLGHPVHLVPGAEEAFKVTRPIDLALARALLQDAGAAAGAVR